MSAEQRRAFDTASLRRVVHTGAPCAIEVKRRMIEWWGPILWEAYGGAEGGGTLVSSEEWLAHPGTVGKPITGSEIKIYGEHGEELPRGQMGLIYMTRYAGDRFEYKGDPEKTRASHRGAFFTLGDIGYLDDDGYLFLCDRQSDLIISFGMNIYPAEIERVLTLNANVADCAVFGIPDTLAGEVPMAVVQLRPGTIGDRQLTSELLSFLSDYLSPTKLPRRVAYTSERLRNDIGKLSRRSLQDRYATVVRPNETTTSASIA
jgi:long-chain acyl-CoA synthetase